MGRCYSPDLPMPPSPHLSFQARPGKICFSPLAMNSIPMAAMTLSWRLIRRKIDEDRNRSDRIDDGEQSGKELGVLHPLNHLVPPSALRNEAWK